MSVQSLIAETKENIQRLEETLRKNCWNEGYVKNVTSQIKFYRNELAKLTPQCSKA
tara:strand:+ start:426 stop:593 length:168 start_codon:yes stop_codon:yes gene_type:complete